MTSFPGSPRVRKGAIVALDPANPLASVIIFQYNPEKLSRKLSARFAAPGGAASEAQRLKGPPQETLNDVVIVIDAIDQLEEGDSSATRLGIHPQLAALEMILYPKTTQVLANLALAALGTLEVIPPEAPLTLFVWGAARVLPVRLTSLTVEEQAHDINLNPIRAHLTLSMQVLTYDDLPKASLGAALYLAHQVAKEAMAVVGTISDLSATGVSGIRSGNSPFNR